MWAIFQKRGIFVANPDFMDATAFADRLKQYGFKWVAVQVLGGAHDEYNVDWITRQNWPEIMRSRGVTFGLWGYNKQSPAVDAKIASDFIGQFDDAAHSTFWIADCEAEYTSWGGDMGWSRAFVQAFRSLRPGRPAALSSYGAAVLDNNLSSVFDYKSWQDNKFDFMPQAYFNQAAELEPMHCIEQAKTAGWSIQDIHPTVGIYDDTLGRIGGGQYGYLLRNCLRRYGMIGWSVFNAENCTPVDLQSLANIAP